MHDKTYNKTCEISKDSDKSINLPSMARVLVYFSLNSIVAVKSIYDQHFDQTAQMHRLIWVFSDRISFIVGFVVCWLNYIFYGMYWYIAHGRSNITRGPWWPYIAHLNHVIHSIANTDAVLKVMVILTMTFALRVIFWSEETSLQHLRVLARNTAKL